MRLLRKGGKLTLLQGLTGQFDPGEMCAILGPSGSGKTTFLDLLAGRKTQGVLTGTILYGPNKPSSHLLRRYVGYVEQHDTLVDTLTVREMLLYTAALKRPLSESTAAKKAAAEALLGKLGLEGCRDTRIGSAMSRGISGGQAKRTNIALALITDARVLLLDEPTSGLDSFTADEVMATVKALCKDGTTVAATIHSPTSYCFGLFDRLLVLLGGRTVYHGPNGAPLIDYFVSSCHARQPTVGDNLAEWLMKFAILQERSTGGAAALADLYNDSHLSKVAAASVADAVWRARERMERTMSLAVLQAVKGRASAAPSASAGSGGRWGGRLTIGGGRSSGGGGGGGGGARAEIRRRSTCGGSAFGLTTSAYVTPAWWSLYALFAHRTFKSYRSWSFLAPRAFEKMAYAALLVILYWGIGEEVPCFVCVLCLVWVYVLRALA